jgi:hypothetical protein
MMEKTPENGYQLVEAYVGAKEKLENALKNAVYSQIGIILDEKDTIEPFFEIRHYNRDYKGTGINRLSDLIYFLVRSDKVPNYKKLKLSPEEIANMTPVELVPFTTPEIMTFWPILLKDSFMLTSSAGTGTESEISTSGIVRMLDLMISLELLFASSICCKPSVSSTTTVKPFSNLVGGAENMNVVGVSGLRRTPSPHSRVSAV